MTGIAVRIPTCESHRRQENIRPCWSSAGGRFVFYGKPPSKALLVFPIIPTFQCLPQLWQDEGMRTGVHTYS